MGTLIGKMQDIVHHVISHPQLTERGEESSCIRAVGIQDVEEIYVALTETYLNKPRRLI